MGVIGVVGNYKSNLKLNGLVKDLNIRDIDKALKIVDLDKSIKNKDLKDLTYTEIFKIDLLTKIDNDLIIIGNMSDYLNYKNQEYIKKVLVKISKNYNKKIIVIDKDVSVFFNLVQKICIKKGNKVIYETSDFYDDKLYKYVSMPKIVEFIKYINSDYKKVEEHTDIYELIKDIYRGIK